MYSKLISQKHERLTGKINVYKENRVKVEENTDRPSLFTNLK